MYDVSKHNYLTIKMLFRFNFTSSQKLFMAADIRVCSRGDFKQTSSILTDVVQMCFITQSQCWRALFAFLCIHL